MIKKGKIFSCCWGCLLVILMAFIFYWRLTNSPSFARSWDEVDFALALDHFDMLAMQPHFPGYPYFILGGMLFHSLIPDPIKSLAVFNIVITLLSCIPVYLLGRRKFSPLMSGVLTLFVNSASYLWIISVSPMSEALAISILWWFLWSIRRALENRALRFRILPLFFYSLLLGTRLSFFPFGLAMIFVWFQDFRHRRKGDNFFGWIVIQICTAVVFQLIWVAALAAGEGGIKGLISLSVGFIEGHFNQWGGAITSASYPFWHRLTVLLFDNFFWTGLAGRSVLAALALGVLVGIAFYKMFNLKKMTNVSFSYNLLLTVLLIFYFIWALVGQNIDKPRHISPMIGIFCFLLFDVLVQKDNFNCRTRSSHRQNLIIMMVLLVTGVQLHHGAVLVKRHAIEEPAAYKLSRELEKINSPFIIYTWEEARIMDYLKVNYTHKRIFTYDLFLQEVKIRKNQRILLTNFVLAGFEKQAGSLQEKVTQIAVFQSDSLFDPVYHKIILYAWNER